jgi:DNA modification methylase
MTEKQIDWLALDNLELWSSNPNQGDVGSIHASINRFGYNDVIAVWNGRVQGGNHRKIALHQLWQGGWRPSEKDRMARVNGDDVLEVAAVDVSHLETEQEANAFGLALNRTTRLGIDDDRMLAALLQDISAVDDDLLVAAGYDGDDVDLLLADLGMQDDPPDDPGAQIDRAEELRQKWQTERGQIWEIPSAVGEGVHRIMCGDSTDADDVARLMGGVKAEILFTSPPYADQREYSGNDLSVATLVQFIPVWKPYCNYQCVNLGLKFSNHEVSQYWDDYIAVARDSGLKLLAWNVWDKGSAGSIGQQRKMFPVSHEFIFVFGESPRIPNRIIPVADATKQRRAYYKKDSEGRNVASRRQANGEMKHSTTGEFHSHVPITSVIKARPEYSDLRKQHPAIMGVELAIKNVEAITSTYGVVLDPFLGSGTTIVACEQTGRVGYGMEIAPGYVAVCLERLAGLGLTPRLING